MLREERQVCREKKDKFAERRKTSLLRDVKISKRFAKKVIKLVDAGVPN